MTIIIICTMRERMPHTYIINQNDKSVDLSRNTRYIPSLLMTITLEITEVPYSRLRFSSSALTVWFSLTEYTCTLFP